MSAFWVEVTFESGEMFRILQPSDYYDEEYQPEIGEWDGFRAGTRLATVER